MDEIYKMSGAQPSRPPSGPRRAWNRRGSQACPRVDVATTLVCATRVFQHTKTKTAFAILHGLRDQNMQKTQKNTRILNL